MSKYDVRRNRPKVESTLQISQHFSLVSMESMIRDENGLQADEIGFAEQYWSELINVQVAPSRSIYFQSATNLTNVSILGRDFSITAQLISKRFTVLHITVQASTSFAVL